MERPDWRNDELTFGQILHPAMNVTDAFEAAQYKGEYIAYIMIKQNKSYEEAERIANSNLGYFAGYYDEETMQRVNRLFRTVHPIFGTKTPTPEEAFEMGRRMGEQMKNG